MLFLQIFLTFTKIGIFNFGGGYAMLSLIHNEIVDKQHWLTSSEFTDIVAISQSTPGPIGMNCATYAGYTAAINSGYSPSLAILCSLLASFSIIWLPFLLMLSISHFLIKHKESQAIKSTFSYLRLVVVGLIASASIMLMTSDNFSSPSQSLFAFIVSILIFVFTFIGSRIYKINPITLIILASLAGLIIY